MYQITHISLFGFCVMSFVNSKLFVGKHVFTRKSIIRDVATQLLSAIDHHLGPDDILLEILTVYDLKLKIKLYEMAILLSS